MAMGDKGAEFRAGIVVLAGILVLAGGLFLVSGGREQLEDKDYYTIYFKNAGGIGNGDGVYLAGRKIGSVFRTATDELKGYLPDAPPRDVNDLDQDGDKKEPEPPVTGIYVTVEIEVSQDNPFPIDSSFYVSKTITGITSFHIEYGDVKGKNATPNTKLRLGRKFSTFAEAVDRSVQFLDRAETVMDDIGEAVKKIKTEVQHIDLEKLQGDLKAFTTSLRNSGAKLEKMIRDGEGKVDATLKDAQATAANLKKLTDQLNKDWEVLGGNLKTASASVKGGTEEFHKLFTDNKGDVKRIVQNVRDFTATLKELNPTIRKIVTEAHGTVAELRPQLVSGMKSARRAFDNFEALTDDLRSAPWKLINKPSDDEVEQIALQNAARNYVMSIERLRRTIEEIGTLKRLGVLDDPEQGPLIKKVLDLLDQSVRDVESNRKALFDRLQVDDKTK